MHETDKRKFEFKAEIKKLLDILVHSLYTNKEIFLRELISNASDALDKLKFESNKGSDIVDSSIPYEIRIFLDKENKKITISDTGIGMNKSEIIENIGTIAKSGSEEFVKQLSSSGGKDVSNIIGKFGVGFYSVFMIAKEVVLTSKSFRKEDKPVVWKSDGLGSYEIAELEENVKRGTKIEIYLKEDALQFLDKFTVESAIKRHSNFISFPIFLENDKMNTIPALWREPKFNVKNEQYIEFYRYLTFDAEEPLDYLHISVDAPVQYNGILFIPKKNLDLLGLNRDNYGIDLYVKRVLIQKQNKDLLPEYLSFIKGVVDSEDIPLNISRETLQENVIISKIKSNIIVQILNKLKKLADEDHSKYLEFYREHNKIFKFGYSDFINKEKWSELLRFNSSILSDDKVSVPFEDYIKRSKENQKEIYYASGASRDAILKNPHLEIFIRKGVEVLYCFDPVDEFVFDSLRQYKEYAIKSVEKADLSKLETLIDIKTSSIKKEELSEEDEKIFDKLIERIKSVLGDKITEVKVSKRLTDSPCCLTSPDNEMNSQFQKILHIINKDVSIPKKVFEINKEHDLIRNLILLYKNDPNEEFINLSIEHLYETSILQEGYLTDPHKLVERAQKITLKASELLTK